MNRFIVDRFQGELENTLKNIAIVDNIIIASLDGIATTYASRTPQDIDSIAAKSASFLSLGDIWEDSSGNLSCDNVIMESKTGTVVVVHMGSKLLLCMTTTSDTTTGMILHHAKSCADRLLDITQSVVQLGERPPLVDSILPESLPNIATA